MKPDRSEAPAAEAAPFLDAWDRIREAARPGLLHILATTPKTRPGRKYPR